MLAIVRRQHIHMAGTVEVEVDRQLFERVGLLFLQVARLLHLAQHDVSALRGDFGAPHGVVERRVLQHADEGGGLFDSEFVGRFIKIRAGGRFDADGVVIEVVLVQIQVDDFVFRIIAFELDGNHPFNGFLQKTLQLVARGRRIKQFG